MFPGAKTSVTGHRSKNGWFAPYVSSSCRIVWHTMVKNTPYPRDTAIVCATSSRRPSAGNSSSMKFTLFFSCVSPYTVSPSVNFLIINAMRSRNTGAMRFWSELGTTRYNEIGFSELMKSSISKSEALVAAASTGSSKS